MIEDLIKKIGEFYELSEIKNDEFSHLEVSRMEFDVKAYDAMCLGRVSYMKAKGMMGLMNMESLIINPFEIDVPLFSLDLIKVLGKYTLCMEMYDTLANENRKEDAFNAIKKEYDHFEDFVTKERWYDAIRYRSSMAKKFKKKDLDTLTELIDRYFEIYLDQCKDARLCDRDMKKHKADQLLDYPYRRRKDKTSAVGNNDNDSKSYLDKSILERNRHSHPQKFQKRYAVGS